MIGDMAGRVIMIRDVAGRSLLSEKWLEDLRCFFVSGFRRKLLGGNLKLDLRIYKKIIGV